MLPQEFVTKEFCDERHKHLESTLDNHTTILAKIDKNLTDLSKITNDQEIKLTTLTSGQVELTKNFKTHMNGETTRRSETKQFWMRIALTVIVAIIGGGFISAVLNKIIEFFAKGSG